MNDILCGYTGDREAALMAYVYDELSPADRAAFDGHLTACARCRTELNAFGAVRRQLAHWTPPTFAGIAQRASDADHAASAPPPPAAARANVVWSGDGRWGMLHALPAWAQAAAAVLVLGAAAGL